MNYRRIQINSPLLISLFTTGAESHVRCALGVPEGTKFKYIIEGRAGIELVVEHESFELLKDGDVIPSQQILMEKIYD